MLAFVMAFFTSLTAMLTFQLSSDATEEADIVYSEATAIGVIAYRTAVADSWMASAKSSGTIADADITLAAGMKRDPNWTNVISGGRLCVYESTPKTQHLLVSTLYDHAAANRYYVGIKSGAQLIDARGYSTGITVCPSVPNGSITLVSR